MCSMGPNMCILGCWKPSAMISWLLYRKILDNSRLCKVLLHFYFLDNIKEWCYVNAHRWYFMHLWPNATDVELSEYMKTQFCFPNYVVSLSKWAIEGKLQVFTEMCSGLVATRLLHLLAVSNLDMFMVIWRPLGGSPGTLHDSFQTNLDYFTAPISVLSWPSPNHITVYWGVLWLPAIYWISHIFWVWVGGNNH